MSVHICYQQCLFFFNNSKKDVSRKYEYVYRVIGQQNFNIQGQVEDEINVTILKLKTMHFNFSPYLDHILKPNFTKLISDETPGSNESFNVKYEQNLISKSSYTVYEIGRLKLMSHYRV